jgi:hypothetical protein
MILNIYINVEIFALILLLIFLRKGLDKFICCSSVAFCAAFGIAVVFNLNPAMGLLLFSCWLIGSFIQFSYIFITWRKRHLSKNPFVVLLVLTFSFAVNAFFAMDFFRSMV